MPVGFALPPNVGQEFISFTHEGFAVSAYMHRAMGTYGDDASGELSASGVSGKSTNVSEESDSVRLDFIIGEVTLGSANRVGLSVVVAPFGGAIGPPNTSPSYAKV